MKAIKFKKTVPFLLSLSPVQCPIPVGNHTMATCPGPMPTVAFHPLPFLPLLLPPVNRRKPFFGIRGESPWCMRADLLLKCSFRGSSCSWSDSSGCPHGPSWSQVTAAHLCLWKWDPVGTCNAHHTTSHGGFSHLWAWGWLPAAVWCKKHFKMSLWRSSPSTLLQTGSGLIQWLSLHGQKKKPLISDQMNRI